MVAQWLATGRDAVARAAELLPSFDPRLLPREPVVLKIDCWRREPGMTQGMGATSPPPERELTNQSRRFRKPASWFILVALGFEVPGILLFVLAHAGLKALGIALMGLGLPVALIGLGLLASAAVAAWSAHRRPFA